MSELLGAIGACVLFGFIEVEPVFGMTSDEAGLIVGGALVVLAAVAWSVERLSSRSETETPDRGAP